MAWTVDWAVSIDGKDVSTAMKPYLTDISVTDKDGADSDTCSLTFDDKGGQVRMPAKGKAIAIRLQGVQVFKGKVDTVRSTGSRGGGRLLIVTGKGFDTRGKAKEGQSFHMDDATLGDFLRKAASNAGFAMIIDPVLDSIHRDYWSADGESLLSLGQRVAREVYGTFKLRADQAVLVKRGGDNGLPGIVATVDPIEGFGNVVNWDIAPFTGRGRYKRSRAEWFDRKEAKFKSKDVENTDVDDDIDTTNVVRGKVADEDQADVVASGRSAEDAREAGEGTVVLDLTPEAQAESSLMMVGARAGVDGTYRIVTVTHKADRRGGATTNCDVKQPGGGAGKDKRK